MTITSTGPSGFHLKPLISVFAVAAIAAGILAIIQVTGTDSPQSTPAPAEVSVEVSAGAIEQYTAASGLAEALADGKLDAGLASAEGQPFAGSVPVPEIVVVEGQGGLHDALVEGKLTMDNPGVQYVAGPEIATSDSGLAEALAEGKLDAGLNSTEAPALAGTAPLAEIAVVEGHGGLHDALISGKFTMDNSSVQYVASTKTGATTSGLWTAFNAGQIDEGLGDENTVLLSPPAADTPTISGGHQK